MVCDCNLGQWCVGHALVEEFSRVFSDSNDEDAMEEKLDALCPECVLAGFDEDDDSVEFESNLDAEGAVAPRFIPEVEAVNETVRAARPQVHQERPAWLPSWIRLIAIIRSAVAPVSGRSLPGRRV